MSDQKADNRRRIPGASVVEDSIHGVEEERRVPNVEETEKPKRRRLAVNPTTEERDPNQRFVPAGFVTAWVNTAGNKPEIKYGEDWDFVLDDDGNKIIREATTRRTDRHQQVYMMKRKEFYDADARAMAKLREDKVKRKAEPDDPSLKKDPFFRDLGLTQHRSDIIDDRN